MQLALSRPLVVPFTLSTKLALWLGVGAVVYAFTVVKGMQDPDFFFHVNTGRLMVKTGSVPSVDHFTFTWEGRPWTPHEWLGALIVYGLDRAIGPNGSTLLFGLFPVASVGVLAWAVRARALAMAVPMLLVGLAIAPFVTLRPQAMSWLGMAVLVAFLLRVQSWRAALWLIPAFVLWANLHGLYVIGLGCVLMYALLGPLPRVPMLGVALGCLLATMLTPAGPEGIMYPLRYLEPGDWGLLNIPEWQSPDFHEPALWLFGGIIVALVLLGLHGPRWLNVLAVLALLGGLFSLRGVPVAAVVAFPLLVYGFDRLRLPALPRNRAAAGVLLVGVVTLAVMQPWSVRAMEQRDRLFPVAAVNALLELDPNARVFTSYYWGGYVGWRMYETGGRVFVDGRNDMYDQAILDDYTAIVGVEPGWEGMLRGAEVIVIKPGRLEHAALGAGWEEVYRDGQAVVLVTPRSAES